jgi:Carboxypeptidase regulatory-like domain
MGFRRVIALVVSTALASASHQSIRLAAQAQAPVAASRQADQAGQLRVSGTVLKSDRKTPIANACLRLRKMDTNTVVARSVSDQKGAFSFAVADPGTYVVEVVKCDDDGVEAVSAALAVTTSTLDIAIVVPTTLAATVFSSTAFLVLSAAAAAGITAVVITRGHGGDSADVLSPER